MPELKDDDSPIKLTKLPVYGDWLKERKKDFDLTLSDFEVNLNVCKDTKNRYINLETEHEKYNKLSKKKKRKSHQGLVDKIISFLKDTQKYRAKIIIEINRAFEEINGKVVTRGTKKKINYIIRNLNIISCSSYYCIEALGILKKLGYDIERNKQIITDTEKDVKPRRKYLMQMLERI